MKTSTPFLAAVLVAAAGVTAQTNLVHNGDFETPGPDPSIPEGWSPFNPVVYRTVGDGLGEILVRGGTHSIELTSGGNFVGYTTDVFNPSTGGYYNPPYTYPGGPVTVTGWYAIPADQPLVGATAGLKLEFRRQPPNTSIYQSFENLSISGHTNGQWVQFSLTVQSSQIDPNFPPFPTQVSVLPFRFGSPSTGTIFWDDITLVQAGVCYANCDSSTAAPVLNVADFTCFLQKFAAGDAYANCDGSTAAPTLNVADFTCFLQKYAAGCP